MPEALIREARLRPEHADSYPEIEPGVWTPAAGLARLVLDRGLYRQAPGTKGDRPLSDAHFEFRGPSLPPESRPGGRSRQTDVTVNEAERELKASQGRLEEQLGAAEAGLDDARDLDRRFEDLERRDEELRRASREPTGPLLPPAPPRSAPPGRQGDGSSG
ncbi:MAG TPA: hypothetical protein VJQ44_02430 [Gemmatimonadales bacterium]|nr:hypothetical protein [Gemmatimonadales bacterium]